MDLKILAEFWSGVLWQLEKFISRELNSEGACERTEENCETAVMASMPDVRVFENRLPDLLIKSGFCYALIDEEGCGIRICRERSFPDRFAGISLWVVVLKRTRSRSEDAAEVLGVVKMN